jgi:hypothetical protein
MSSRPRFRGGFRTEAVPALLADALGLDGRPLPAAQARAYREVRVPINWVEGPIPGHAEWRYAARLSVQAGRVVIAELRIMPAETWRGRYAGIWSGAWSDKATVPPAGLTTRILRAIRLGRIEAETRDFVAWAAQQRGGLAFEPARWLGAPIRRPRPSGPARRRAPDAHSLALMAARWVAARATDPRRPNVALAAQLGLSVRDVTEQLVAARERGLLTKPPARGKVSGELTLKAKRLLNLIPTPRRSRKR